MREPKYLKIKRDMLEKIEGGIFQAGDRFYTEAEIKELYNVSSITAIRAVQELCKEGLLERFQGKGTYVARSKKRQLVELSDVNPSTQQDERIVVKEITEEKNPVIRKLLEIDELHTYFKIVRIHYVGNTPAYVDYCYLPSRFINREYPNMDYYQKVYPRLKADRGINMYEMKFIETHELTNHVPQEVSQWLEKSMTDIYVLEKHQTMDEDGFAIEYVETYRPWEQYNIKIESI